MKQKVKQIVEKSEFIKGLGNMIRVFEELDNDDMDLKDLDLEIKNNDDNGDTGTLELDEVELQSIIEKMKGDDKKTVEDAIKLIKKYADEADKEDTDDNDTDDKKGDKKEDKLPELDDLDDLEDKDDDKKDK